MDAAELDAQRTRWRRWRKRQALTAATGTGFATGGLARLVEDPELRIVFLAADPAHDAVPFGKETLEWLGLERVLPFNDQAKTRPWSYSRSSADTLVCYERAPRGTLWSSYLAIHRHGGIESAWSSISYPVHELKAFALRQIVGCFWLAASLQAEAAGRWSLEGPFETTVALRNTRGAAVGNFAEGWRQPGPELESVLCLDEHVLLSREIGSLDDVESLAIDMGDRLEQAFGTVHRRHLAARGEFADKFDPRGVFP